MLSSAGRGRLLGEMAGVASEQGMAEQNARKDSSRGNKWTQNESARQNLNLPPATPRPAPPLDEPTILAERGGEIQIWGWKPLLESGFGIGNYCAF